MSGSIANSPLPIGQATGSSLADRLAGLTDGRWFVTVVSLLFALPMFCAPVLPLVDIGGHIGRYAIQLDGGLTPELAQWYTFTWSLLPNLGADLIVQMLAPGVGVEAAARVAVALAVVLQVSGILVLSKKLHERITPWALLTLPLVYSFPFQFGFLNFVLGFSVALWAMVAWLHFETALPLRRGVVFALIASLVWLCHLVGWGVFCILAGSRELVRRWQSSDGIFAVLRDTTLAVSCLLVPLAIGAIFSPEGGDPGKTDGWFEYGWKLLHLLNVMLDRWELFDRLALTIVLMGLFWGLIVKEARTDPGTGLAAALLAACAISMPSQVLGSHYADIRLFPIVLVVGLLAIAPAQQMSRDLATALLVFAMAFVGVRLAGTAASAQMNGAALERELTVLDRLPKHSQLVTLRARNCHDGLDLSIDRTTHLGGYAIARRAAFSNDQWQLAGAQLLRVHNPTIAPFDRGPSQFTFTRPCGDDKGIEVKAAQIPKAASHLWVIWDDEPKPLQGWSRIATGKTSVLYKRND